MRLLIVFLGAVIASVVISGLILPRDASAQDRTLTLFGSVKGESVPDGHAELAFNFYDKDTNALVYRSVSTAVVKDGAYTASLRADDLTEGKEYYVLATLPEGVPESFQGARSDPLGIVLLQPSTPGIQQVGHVNISGTLIAGAIQTDAFRMSTGAGAGRVLTSDASGNGTWQALPPPSGTAGGDLAGTYPNPLVDGLQGFAVASTAPTSGQVLKWTGSAWSPGTDLGDTFWQASGSNIYFNAGNVGIGTSGPVSPLHVVSGTEYAIYGQSDSNPGYGVYGVATATSGGTVGVYGQSDSGTSGYGVFGYATAANGGTTGVYGRSQSTSGRGVVGYASANSGTTYGGWFESTSTSGSGVYGYASATKGHTYGGWFESESTFGTGVYGLCYSTGGYGVYSFGNFAATGSKSFQMDHPLMPETHYLNHFCTEGPEPYNAYNGNVVTDAKGYATVRLPDYFESINRDFRYQLTVIDDSDDFVLAKVVREIQNNQFVIRTNKPRVKVSWEVKAVRNDRWVQEYGYKTEQEKEDEIKGKYLNPELFGMPKEYGIHYRPDVEKAKRNERNLQARRVPDSPRSKSR